jgi:hypothetical protein
VHFSVRGFGCALFYFREVKEVRDSERDFINALIIFSTVICMIVILLYEKESLSAGTFLGNLLTVPLWVIGSAVCGGICIVLPIGLIYCIIQTRDSHFNGYSTLEKVILVGVWVILIWIALALFVTYVKF